MDRLEHESFDVADERARGCGDAAPADLGLTFVAKNEFDLDPAPLRGIAIPHPADCEPRRTPRNPKWLPTRRDRRDAGWPRLTSAANAGWGEPRIVAAPDAGAVRIGMTWRQFFVTSASFSRKAGRTMFFEGPHEPASYRRRETDYRSTDLQFQPLVIEWVLDGKVIHSYYVDSVEERDTGVLVFRENKAHQAYFDDPLIDEKLSAAAAVLTRYPDVVFERELGTDLIEPRSWRITKDIFDDRRVNYTEAQRDAVRNLLVGAGGAATLGKVWEAIGGRPANARRIANAMLVARVVGFPNRQRSTGDTLAVLPRAPARPGRLREFLRSFVPETPR